MYKLAEFIEVLHDKRVVNALEIALRDAKIRRQFRRLRRELTVAVVVERLADEFCLSEERIRAIAYQKG